MFKRIQGRELEVGLISVCLSLDKKQKIMQSFF